MAGCNATMQQARQPGPADDPTSHCLRALDGMPQLASIGKRTPLFNANTATVEMLADAGHPSEQEKAELSLWAKMRTDCVAQGRSFRAQYAPPGWSNVVEAAQVEVLQAIASLYAGTATYGQFNRDRQQITSRTTSALQAVVANAQNQVRADRQAASMEAVQALQTMQLLQAMQPQPLPMPQIPPPPRTINCSSRNVMGTVYTDCR